MSIQKKSLRQIMTDEIKNSDWLDYKVSVLKEGGLPGTPYVDYLEKLDDTDFLAAYNRVCEAEAALD